MKDASETMEMPGGRGRDAAAVLAMPEAMFLNEVTSRMHGIFGKIELARCLRSLAAAVAEDRIACERQHGQHAEDESER